MVVGEANIHNIMSGMESTGGVRLHNHKKKLKQRFDIIKKLGQGTYGKVQLGINKETGQEVAIKTIKKCKIETEADLIRIRREIQIMSSVQHPNIIHIYEVFENREKMVLVMEYAAGGELYDYLSERKVLVEEEARRIFRQISTAVFYCHKHKICHRDLKLENILLDSLGNAKIADFGLSNVFDEQRLLNTFCGSPLYASPEIVKGTPYHGPEVDCWSLGVLLYTLVYGAMPFDGSNFKRLTRQISASVYFEPKTPSPASPLIKEMLTKCPNRRADIERICSHWWVNEGYQQNCLDIAEELAAQTPVRLDLLLSLVPQSASADKLVVTNDQQTSESTNNMSTDNIIPTRCHSVGSLMELDKTNSQLITYDDDNLQNINNDIKRKSELVNEEKRKESCKKKEHKENDEREQRIYKSSSRHYSAPIANSTIDEAMEIDLRDPSTAAACLELIKEAQSNSSNNDKNKILESSNAIPTVSSSSQINLPDSNKNINNNNNNNNNNMNNLDNLPKNENEELLQEKIDVNVNDKIESKNDNKKIKQKALSLDSDEIIKPTKSTERRRSKIFETAEKFNQLSSGVEAEKPKKIFIPGVNVGGAKKVFERKASLSSSTTPQFPKQNSSKVIIDVPTDKKINNKVETIKNDGENSELKRDEEKKRAVDIITGALGKPPMQKKFTNGSSSSSSPITSSSSTDSNKIGLKIQIGPNDVRNATVSVTTPIETKYPEFDTNGKPIITGTSVPTTPESIKNNLLLLDEPKVSSKMEITLKSATLPRPRKTSKAEITLAGYKSPEAAFKSQIEAKIAAFQPPKLKTQKSEVAFPVTPVKQEIRSCSLEPENKFKERIIPIHIEPGHHSSTSSPPPIPSSLSSSPPPPPLPPSKPPLMPQRSLSQRSGSLSRQSTADSDTDSLLGSTNISSEPIKKSPREYIIPIAVEGGGYVTPRSGSVESESKTNTSINVNSSKNKFGKPRRMGSLLSDASEDESPFSTLQRESDDLLQRHMHRLRSSRPSRQTSEHADSLSSGEDDDDDGFELLTAENLFSTLLSRVRSLTQRLNVDENRYGSGFPCSRILNRFNSNSSQGFWRLHEPLSRRMSESSFGRSFSRDTDKFGRKDSAMSSNPGTPSLASGRNTPSRESIFEMGSSNTLPRDKSHREGMDNKDSQVAADDNELTLEESCNLSKNHKNFTPSLTRRLSRQFIEQTRQSLPRSPSIPREKLYRSLTSDSSDSFSSLIIPDRRTSYRSKSSDRSLRRVNSLLESDRPEKPDFRTTRRSVSLFADEDDELLSALPPRKYRDPIKSTNSIRKESFCRAEKIQEEPNDDSTSPKRHQNDQNDDDNDDDDDDSDSNLESVSKSQCKSNNTNTMKQSESNENTQNESLNSFKADAKDFESRLTAAENLIKASKLRNLGLNTLDNKDYSNMGSMNDLTNSVLNRRLSCIPSLRFRSGSLTREISLSNDKTNERSSTPERSLLSKLFRSSSVNRDSDNKSPKAKRKISRFLRPDFFDTPREESQYVKEKEAQKAAENERRKSRFMKKKINNNNKDVNILNLIDEKLDKELKNEVNTLTKGKNEQLPTQINTCHSNDNNNFKNNVQDLSSFSDIKSNNEVILSESNVLSKENNVSDDKTSIKETNSSGVVSSKSKVSSVLGLFKTDSKSIANVNANLNGTRQLLNKFKKNTYKGSRSDTSVITGEISSSSKIPMKSKIDIKSFRTSLELKNIPDTVAKDKNKEKTPPEKQIKSPKILNPDKSIEKSKIKDKSVEKESRKSGSPDNKTSFSSRLISSKKSSPEKLDLKNIENENKKLLKKKDSKSLIKNGSVSKLEKCDNTDKKIKKIVKKQVSVDDNDNIKKKKIVRVVKKVVKSSDSSSDSKSEEKEKLSSGTLLKRMIPKKDQNPEKNKKLLEDKVTLPTLINLSKTTTIEQNKNEIPNEAKVVLKNPQVKSRGNRSNLKLDFSKIPQHTFKNEKLEFSKEQIFDKTCNDTNFNENIQTPKEQLNEVKEDFSKLLKETEDFGKNVPKVIKNHSENIYSPTDECESFDSWSICSNDLNNRSNLDLYSPTSPVYSHSHSHSHSHSLSQSPSNHCDHSESIIDRIKRKSFYSRFNERRRKSCLNVSPSGIGLPSSSSTLSRKYSFHSTRDIDHDRKNLTGRRISDKTYSLTNDDLTSFRKSSSIERDRHSDISNNHSFSTDLKSLYHYDPLKKYRLPSNSESSSTLLNNNYSSNLNKKYSCIKSGLEPKSPEYYQQLLSPTKIDFDYISKRRTPIPGERSHSSLSFKYENGFNNDIHIDKCKEHSTEDKSQFSKDLDSSEDNDKSREDDIKNSIESTNKSKELSAACPDSETTTSIVD